MKAGFDHLPICHGTAFVYNDISKVNNLPHANEFFGFYIILHIKTEPKVIRK